MNPAPWRAVPVGASKSSYRELTPIDRVSAPGFFEHLYGFSVRPMIANRATAASFDGFHRVQDFEHRLRLFAKEAMYWMTFGIQLPLHKLRREDVRITAGDALGVHDVKSSRRVLRMSSMNYSLRVLHPWSLTFRIHIRPWHITANERDQRFLLAPRPPVLHCLAPLHPLLKSCLLRAFRPL
jgi:hypothetical protein